MGSEAGAVGGRPRCGGGWRLWDDLVRIVKRKLKKIQYRLHLIDGCLARTGLAIEAG